MLEIESLSVSYGSVIALRDLSFQVSHGEVLALIGPNGAGKTTLIRALSGVRRIKSGSVRFRGQDLVALTNLQRARLLAVVPQDHQLGGAFTVAQTVLMGRTPHMSWLGRAGPDDIAAVQRAVAQTGLEELVGRRNAQLSGGERQRVLLARALAQDTPLLLMDEPTAHLDLRHQVAFLSLVRELAHEQNLVVLMAMHDLNQVSMYADRVALLVDGVLQGVGLPSEVMTAKYLTTAYQTPIQVLDHPEDQTPLIFPDRAGTSVDS